MSHLEEIYQNAGFTGKLTVGQKPAILVIDLQTGFTDPAQSTLAGDYTSQVMQTSRVLEKAREKGVPVFFVISGYRSVRDGGVWIRKVPAAQQLKIGSPLVEVDPRLNRRADEVLLIKHYASAFAGTPLTSLLAAEGIDTLFVAGVVTSGCVRASVVDAVSNGFAPFVIREAVGDRAEGPHLSNLFDLQAKYAEVVSVEEVLSHLA